MSFMGADGIKNAVYDNWGNPLNLLPDSIKEIIHNRKFIMYDYGHHGKKWCLIYEEGDSYNFKIGTTRNERLDSASPIDTARLMAVHRDLICWGIDTLPYITENMDRQYPEQWSTFYTSLSVFNQQSDMIFSANNVVGFEGPDNMAINADYRGLCYLMYWLSDPEIRTKLPGFEDYIK